MTSYQKYEVAYYECHHIFNDWLDASSYYAMMDDLREMNRQ